MGTLYDMNKNVIANLSALSKRQVKDRLLETSEYIKKTDNRYYMMLCHEARDYTVFNIQKNEPIDSPFKGTQNKVTIHTYIRNKIHHPKENWWVPTPEELKQSIEKMRSYL